jgi:nitrate/nitrite transport system substrate-binding protein
MTQMRRWGQITESKPAEWYASKSKKSINRNLDQNSSTLLKEGNLSAKTFQPFGYKPATDFIDGVKYDGKMPLE